jgi:hypothetical protein
VRLRALFITLGLVLATPVAALLLPSAAAAQGTSTTNPFTPGLPVSPTTISTASTPTIVPTTTSTGAGAGLGGGSVVAIAVGALVLLGGISFFIWRDARRRAPVRHRVAATAGEGRPGSKARGKPRKLSPAERRRRKRGRAR